MSAINREIDWSRLSTLLDFVLEQRLKGVNTALPAIVETYDSATRRARVLPALRLLMTDGTTQRRAPLVNVPVAHPSGGGFTLLLPLSAGDAVLLVFSQRGLAEFKRQFSESDPTADRLFDLSDAVALAGFGSLSVTPATSTGASLQTEDGASSIRVEERDVVAVAPGEIRITAGAAVSVSAPTITLN